MATDEAIRDAWTREEILIAALRRYCQHEHDCESNPQWLGHFQQATSQGRCTCGLAEALKDAGVES